MENQRNHIFSLGLIPLKITEMVKGKFRKNQEHLDDILHSIDISSQGYDKQDIEVIKSFGLEYIQIHLIYDDAREVRMLMYFKLDTDDLKSFYYQTSFFSEDSLIEQSGAIVNIAIEKIDEIVYSMIGKEENIY